MHHFAVRHRQHQRVDRLLLELLGQHDRNRQGRRRSASIMTIASDSDQVRMPILSKMDSEALGGLGDVDGDRELLAGHLAQHRLERGQHVVAGHGRFRRADRRPGPAAPPAATA